MENLLQIREEIEEQIGILKCSKEKVNRVTLRKKLEKDLAQIVDIINSKENAIKKGSGKFKPKKYFNKMRMWPRFQLYLYFDIIQAIKHQMFNTTLINPKILALNFRNKKISMKAMTNSSTIRYLLSLRMWPGVPLTLLRLRYDLFDFYWFVVLRYSQYNLWRDFSLIISSSVTFYAFSNALILSYFLNASNSSINSFTLTFKDS